MKDRRGAVLIEVIVAVAILTSAGLSFLQLVLSVGDAQTRMHERERELARAERLLTATVLLTQPELERRLGVRPANDFLVWIDRPEPFLFRIGVSTAGRPEAELLSTLAYRRQEERDEE
jgi:type II secretory pathway component PulJ